MEIVREYGNRAAIGFSVGAQYPTAHGSYTFDLPVENARDMNRFVRFLTENKMIVASGS